MRTDHVEMAADGSLVLPAWAREALGIIGGGRLAVVVVVEGGTVKLEAFAQVIRRVQAEIGRHIPAGRDLVAELSEERRREAELE